MAACQSGLWSPPSSVLACVEGVALVTLGGTSSVEVYGPGGLTKRLSNMKDRFGHSLDYLEGAVYQCGGYLVNFCLRGVPNHASKGNNFCISFESNKKCSAKLQTCLDITWTVHSTLEARYRHSSSVVLGTLHLLGGNSGVNGGRKLKTEHLDKDKWTTGIQLENSVIYGCAVVSPPDEVITIAGDGESDRVMYRYNMTSGELTRFATVPLTQADFYYIIIYHLLSLMNRALSGYF